MTVAVIKRLDETNETVRLEVRSEEAWIVLVGSLFQICIFTKEESFGILWMRNKRMFDSTFKYSKIIKVLQHPFGNRIIFLERWDHLR